MRCSRSKVAEANKYFAIEATFALLVSFFINMAVVVVFSVRTHQHRPVIQRCRCKALQAVIGSVRCAKEPLQHVRAHAVGVDYHVWKRMSLRLARSGCGV